MMPLLSLLIVAAVAWGLGRICWEGLRAITPLDDEEWKQ